MELCNEVFRVTKNFPKVEMYSLTSQINRSAISVPSNITEGSSRKSSKEFKRFLEISLGSLFELQTQITLSGYKEYLNEKELKEMDEKTEELQKMIFVFFLNI